MEETVKNFVADAKKSKNDIEISQRTEHEMNTISKMCGYRNCSEELIGYSAEFCCSNHRMMEQSIRKTAVLT